jgi:hypothetical protein
MKHLSPSEFVDYVDGALDPERTAHIAACGVCRREAETLRATVHEASIADAPEPSPLFWDHLRARVREEIAAPAPRTPWFRAHLAQLTAAVVALAVVAGILVSRTPVEKRVERRSPLTNDYGKPLAALSSAQREPSFLTAQPAAPKEDEAWMLLQDAAEDLQIEDARAAGFSVRPGVVDRAVLDLSARERAELGRLIEDEIRQARRPTSRAAKEIS